jgi:hypothetical protein
MEASLSLKKEIDLLVQNESNSYSDRLSGSFEKTSESRFNELKEILTKFNKEYLLNSYLKNRLFNHPDQ